MVEPQRSGLWDLIREAAAEAEAHMTPADRFKRDMLTSAMLYGQTFIQQTEDGPKDVTREVMTGKLTVRRGAP